MKILNKAHLIYEMNKIRTAIKNKDGKAIEKYYNDLQNRLSIPKKDVFHGGLITLCSKDISYHLLSVYLLLDMIEYFWDEKSGFNNRTDTKEFFLLNELSVYDVDEENPVELPMADVIPCVERVERLIKTKLFVFLIPFEFDRNFTLQISYPGNCLILYANRGTKIQDIFFRAVSQFYLRHKFNGRPPYWAGGEEGFHIEFMRWCNQKPSQFRE